MKLFKRNKADASASTEPPKERYGLFPLHDPPDADVDIVAVHGLGGHYEETWTDSDSKQLWLRDFLPSQLKEVGIVARIMSYGYDSTTAFSKSVTDIEDQARIMIDTLNSERASQSEKDRPLVFISHSLGGIIVKKAIIIAHERSSLYATVLHSIQALVFFGVPHRGSDLAYWSTYAARLTSTVQLGLGTNKSFVEALTRNSQTLDDISQSFTERAAPLKIRTFYETEKLHGFLVVDKDSARLGLSNENAVGVIAADHRTICKFNSRDSQRYRPVWKAIQVLCEKKEENKASTQASKPSESPFLVPFPRDPHFLGREDIIDSVNAKFKTERRVALTGAGGVGKSQIAIEYCYRFRDREADPNVFWIHASNKGRFEQAFKAISKKLRLPGWDNPDINSLDLVSDWLSGDSKWLLVLDNADDSDVFFDRRPTITFQHPESQRLTVPLAKYIPQTSRRGSVLLTSRNRDAAFRLTDCVENLIDVPYMSKEDATALLCTKLREDHSSDDEKLELVDLLEYLPLAITQAASYIGVRRPRMSVARYSSLLRKNDRILHDDMGDSRRDLTIPSSVFLTWQISFDQISKENGLAAELLSIMSVFDRQGIPQFLLQNMAEDDLDFERRLAPLADFSLITVDESGQTFQMHRLVQTAIISWLEGHGEIDRWKKKAALLIERSLPNSNYESWKTWEILLPHAEIALKYHFPNQDSQLLHAEILGKTARYFEQRGGYDAATERCQRALGIQVEILGEDDLRTVGCLLLLAVMKRRGGGSGVRDIDEAEVLCRRALRILELGQEKDSRKCLQAKNDLAVVLLDSHNDKQIEEATKLLRSVLVSNKQSLGLEHDSTLATMHNLASALHGQKEYTEAEKLRRQVLETKLRILGDEHPSTLISLSNLAILLLEQRKYKEAQEHAQRALDLRMTVLGQEHPDTMSSMIFLINALDGQGKYMEAEEVGRYALSLHKTFHGDAHHMTSGAMAALGRTLHHQGKCKEAEELFRKVYERRPRGWDDGDWDRFLRDCSDTLAKQGKHDEAAEINRQRVRRKDSDLDSTYSGDTELVSEFSEDSVLSLPEVDSTKDHLRPRCASFP